MIKGLTDNMRLRRDGKVRSGSKNAQGYPTNSPTFLLHDAPGLSSVLGDKPTEIFFTVGSDEIEKAAQNDLRYYTKSELVCMGNGESAAFFALGERQGVSNEQVPGMRARKRTCNYKSCSDYIQGNCSEHVMLDMVIPQYSMSSIFTLESTSIIAVMNIVSCLTKSYRGRMGKIAGEIFRIYKDKQDVKFIDTKSGKNASRETDIVNMQHVPFDIFEKEHRSKISDDNWEVLMFWRGLPSGRIDRLMLPETQATLQINGETVPQLEAPKIQGKSLPDPAAQEDALKARANAPEAAPWFDKIAKLAGKPNTEAVRIATAKNFSDVGQVVDYLKTKIKEMEKKAANVTPPPQVGTTTVVAPGAADNLL
jgi:hypothetical protein